MILMPSRLSVAIVPMDASTLLAHRFGWADVVYNCFLSWFGRPWVESSLICRGEGTDSDCSGGAGGWEAGSSQLRVAGTERGLPIRLRARTVCEKNPK